MEVSEITELVNFGLVTNFNMVFPTILAANSAAKIFVVKASHTNELSAFLHCYKNYLIPSPLYSLHKSLYKNISQKIQSHQRIQLTFHRSTKIFLYSLHTYQPYFIFNSTPPPRYLLHFKIKAKSVVRTLSTAPLHFLH